MRHFALLLAAAASALVVAPAGAQQGTGQITGRVFMQDTGQGGDEQVWVQAFKMPGLVEARGACVSGFDYEIGDLDEGTYKIRFGFGCGDDGDRAPHEWFAQTSAPECAADVIVSAGYTTDGINADVDPQRGPEHRCVTGGETTPRQSPAGVQRPIAGPTASPRPTGEVSFSPGVVSEPMTTTPTGVVVGAGIVLAVAVAGFLVWLSRRRPAG